jgi:acyl-CoA reductase-like NAD-dependent aldehyde dehydrogenase
MNEPLAWLVEDCGAGVREEFRFRRAFLHASELPPPEIAEQFTVTPLIAAPPAQTVAEVQEMLNAFTGAFCGVEYATSDAERARLLAEADAIEDRLLSIVSCAAPPEGAPSARDVAALLVEAVAYLPSYAAECLNSGRRNSHTEMTDLHARARALLSRLPQQQEGTDR